MSLSPQLRDAAIRWIADDVSDDDRAELQRVLADAMAGKQSQVDELRARMSGTLKFGTAGLRAPVRAGSNGMNRAVVVRTTAGVAEWLAAHGHGGGLVYVGRDARHGSARFAADAAEVLTAAGFRVRLIDGPAPTPILAAAVTRENAVAGIQITASHNPAGDNGYKLYDATGTQIIPPSDAEIETAVGRVPAAVSVPRLAAYDTVRGEVLEPYLRRVATLPRSESRDIRIAVTALYGVGGETASAAFARAGFTDVHFVQSEPDPDFGGLAFPNPEEPGACDELLSKAAEIDADLAIAFDPDADRCAVGIPAAEGFRTLRGDETGALLGGYLLSTSDTADPLVATSIVSSSMLSAIAAAHGARYAETLTGFKWLARAGDGLIYAYEEALGLCVDPDVVHDKDGISAAIVAADLAAERKARGSSLTAALDELATAHGVHLSDQISIWVSELDEIGVVMKRLRDEPPARLAGAEVTAEDLLPTTDGLRCTGDGVRVIVRPSGTEPKLKAYLQVIRPVDTDLAVTRTAATKVLTRLRTDVERLLA